MRVKVCCVSRTLRSSLARFSVPTATCVRNSKTRFGTEMDSYKPTESYNKTAYLRKRHRRRPQQRPPRLRYGSGRLRRARVEDRAVVRPLVTSEVRQRRRQQFITNEGGAPSRTILITREARLD